MGHVTVVDTVDHSTTVHRLHDENYDAVVERGVIITIDAFDWNCPQHIPQRYTLSEIENLNAITLS